MRDAIVDLCRTAVRDVHGLAVEESEPILVGEGTLLQCFIKDAVAAAHHSLFVDAVGKPEAWAKCLVIDVLWALATISPASGTEIGVCAEDISRIRVGEL